MQLSFNFPSPIETILFEGERFFLKRDDLIHSDFSGNKARKFYYYVMHDFPEIQKIVSSGSNQSNAMYSLSVLAKVKGWDFEYFVDHIPDYLREYPQGNYKAALKHGMKIRVQNPGLRAQGEGELWIEEGGRQREADVGVGLLAEEIVAWQQEQGINSLKVFLPSGTGTTALFLQKNCLLLTAGRSLKTAIFTTPCVGDAAYLKKQFLELEVDEAWHPMILDLEKKYHFGKLYRESYKIWLKLRHQTGVEFDLLYDPKGWMTLLAHLELLEGPWLYVHQGGVLGNESMLPRYERKYKDLTSENNREQYNKLCE
ncbi:MAG TPA: 1-aminocyclopropane-1-carboxylate deaminase/D-cysteine desulfhydrase [Epsilonproteobacteria bacterium]|nr:1-aminocyclopropane-1-carboxylate deaminase/D-cysteine desulfhydrase [Campylobacterota bacterium]